METSFLKVCGNPVDFGKIFHCFFLNKIFKKGETN